MNVLLITKSTDNAAPDRVRGALEARGARVFRLDTDHFPTDVEVAFHDDHTVLTVPDGTTDLEGLDAVYYRRATVGAALPADLDPQLREAAVGESRALLFGALAAAAPFTLDPYDTIRHASQKPLQHRLARAVGLEVPRTLMTNAPDAARAFWRACDGRVVCKMQTSFRVLDGDEEQVVFTNRLTAADVDALDGLRLGPMVFQEEIEKRRELRVTVVGDRVFTAAVDSQALLDARVDWRREGEALADRWIEAELPADAQAALLRLMDRLGLNYGAADFIQTPDGRCVFLEVNPGGEWLWLAESPGLPIADALADVLTGQVWRR